MKKDSISVCIITCNEADKLKRCLTCLVKYPFELVVVDTGSTDESIQLAREFTSNVFSFKWCEDFSAVRNYAASKASNEYVLMVDTDEYLEACNYDELILNIKNNPVSVGRIRRINSFERDGELIAGHEYVSRLYRKDKYFYKGRVHEQIVSYDGLEYETYITSLIFKHDGYNGSKSYIKIKAERNIALLTALLKESPKDPYVLYQLGKSYYMLQDYVSADKFFTQATLLDVNPKCEYVSDLVITYGYCLLQLKEYKKAMTFENLWDDFGYLADFRFLMGLIYMNNARFNEAVEMFILATECKDCTIEGVNSYKAFYNIGVIYECLRDYKMAVRYYQKAGNYQKADERIKIIDNNNYYL